jgi:hypothetical protein
MAENSMMFYFYAHEFTILPRRRASKKDILNRPHRFQKFILANNGSHWVKDM